MRNPEAADLPTQLARLRGEIDGIDDALHDLLMRRARVVGQVAELRTIGKIPFRPGREAAIIRRLLGRHSGRLPPHAVVRLWREIFAANIAIEQRFRIAAYEPGPGETMAQVAREHFGALTPLGICRSAAQALAEVSAGEATAAVLPMPAEDQPEAAVWWTGLLRRDVERLHVVARLPFWASPRSEGAVTVEALVVAAAAPDRSGADRSLIGVELPSEYSRERLPGLLSSAGFTVSGLLLCGDPSGAGGHGLADVDGFVDEDDPRLGMLRGAVVLGSYAAPVGEAAP